MYRRRFISHRTTGSTGTKLGCYTYKLATNKGKMDMREPPTQARREGRRPDQKSVGKPPLLLVRGSYIHLTPSENSGTSLDLIKTIHAHPVYKYRIKELRMNL